MIDGPDQYGGSVVPPPLPLPLRHHSRLMFRNLEFTRKAGVSNGTPCLCVIINNQDLTGQWFL